MSGSEFLGVVVVLLIAVPLGYRAGRAATVDEVTQPFRARLLMWVYQTSGEDGDDVEAPPRWKLHVMKLFSCQVCFGFWTTLVAGLIVSGVFLDQAWYKDLLLAGAATGLECLVALRELPRTPS